MTIPELIQELVSQPRRARPEELDDIIHWAAELPFNERLVRADPLLMGHTHRGIEITPKTRLPSVEAHLLKRIYVEQQWPPGTTTDQYIADLHTAIGHPEARIWTYRLFNLPFVGFLAPSHIGGASRPEPFIYVACNAQDQRITTGYQASSVEAIPALTKLAESLVSHR